MNAVVAGLPRSWHTAPSITASCCGRGRSSMRVRARSITCRLWTQTSPSGCHSGSCGQPASACSSGNSFAMTPRSIATVKPIDGFGAKSSFSNSPQTRSAGRSSSGICRQSAAVDSSSVSAKRAANCTRAQHARLSSPNVCGSTTRSRRRSRSPRPSNGSKYSPVSGSHEIALTVKSRRRAASAIDMSGSPVTTKPRWPRPAFESRRGSETSMSPIL